MLDQKFTGKSLLRLTSLKDIIRFNLGRNRDEYLEKLEFIANKIANEECNFSDITFYEKNRKKYLNRVLLKAFIVCDV